MLNVLLMILLLFLIIPVFILLGSIILEFFNLNFKNDLVFLNWSLVVSIIFFSLLSVFFRVLKINYFLMPLIVFSLLFFSNKKRLKKLLRNSDVKFLLSTLFLLLLLSTGINSLLKSWWRGGDYLMYFSTAKLFSTQEEWIVRSGRAPLFSLVISFFFSVFPKKLFVYKLVGSFLSSIFIIPLFIIIKKKFSEVNARISVLFTGLLPLTLSCFMGPWPKILTAFFLLLLVLEFFVKETFNWIVVFLFMSLSFLTHSYSVFYLLSFFLILFFMKDFNIFLKPSFFVGVSLFILIISPWIYHNVKYSDVLDTSLRLYYPIGIEYDHPMMKNLNKSFIIDNFKSVVKKNPLEILRIRFLNCYFTISPLTIFHKYIPQVWPLCLTGNLVHNSLEDRFLFASTDTFFGSLTFLFCFFCYLGFWDYWKDYKNLSKVIILPLVFYSLFIGFYLQGEVGFVQQSLYPSVYLLVPFGVKKVLEYNKKLVKPLFIIFLFNVFIFLVLVWWKSSTNVIEGSFYHLFQPYNILFFSLVLLVFSIFYYRISRIISS